MATRKRNEFLDLEGSDGDESDRGYDSEAIEESKGRSSKRRRVLNNDNDHDHSDESQDEGDDVNNEANGVADSRFRFEGDDDGDDEDIKDQGSTSSKPAAKGKEGPAKLLQKPIKKKKDKSGVIYFSSLPPYLKPFALKSLLLQRGFGPINRIFLTPAVPSTSGAGKRGSKRKLYSDGWVEFESKKVAKICAETLNATTVGGRGWFRDNVWNMKYLRGFRWADLMEQVQIERSQREAQRRIEDMRSRKEDKVFLSGVEKGKVIEGIRKKREDKAKANDTVPEDIQIRRVFRQNEVREKDSKGKDTTMDEDAKRVLGKIF